MATTVRLFTEARGELWEFVRDPAMSWPRLPVKGDRFVFGDDDLSAKVRLVEFVHIVDDDWKVEVHLRPFPASKRWADSLEASAALERLGFVYV